MNIMPHNLDRKSVDAAISTIAETTAEMCLATRVRQLSRIVTRVYDDALRPLGITASQYTLLAQLASRDGITAVEIVVCPKTVVLVVWLKATEAPLLIWFVADVTVAVRVTAPPGVGEAGTEVRLVTELLR